MFKRNSRNANNTIGYTRNVTIAERLATGNHQEPKGRQQQQECLPQSGYKAIAVTQATTVTPITGKIKNDCNIMTAHKNRNTSNSRNESNSRTANTVWTLSKAGILAKTVKPAIAWREPTAAETIGTSQRQQQKGNPQQQH